MNRHKTLPREDDQLDLAEASIAYALAGGDIVGVVCMRPARNTNTLNVMLGYVDPVHRRKGVFTRLISEVEAYAQKKGYRSLSTVVRVENDQSLALLEKLKFEDVSINMEKRLL